MLQRITHPHGIVTYQSPLLREIGVIHAFSTRVGGVSGGPYASLNLGPLTKGGYTDHNTSVSENFRRLRRAIGAERTMRTVVKQVHGCEIWQPPAEPVRAGDEPEADAIITGNPLHFLVIRVADCVPILLASADGGRVAAIHAGWRGLVAGVIPETVERFGPVGAAAIGPCISLDRFEVGDEVAAAFDGANLGDTIGRTAHTKPHIDLRAAARLQLQRAGVTHVDITDRCTYRDADEFFSHRRDVTHQGQPTTGRMTAVIFPLAHC